MKPTSMSTLSLMRDKLTSGRADMATLESLKQALRREAEVIGSSSEQPLSDLRYNNSFDVPVQISGWMADRDLVLPQLSQLLSPLFDSRVHISALEIAPGPESLLARLPNYMRRKITTYTAFEPVELFAENLEKWLCSTSGVEGPLPCLENLRGIHRVQFSLHANASQSTSTDTHDPNEKYDIILFCPSMYTPKPERPLIERALKMLVKHPQGGMVVFFHRDEALHFDGIVCHQTASFPDGIVRVVDEDEALDCFAGLVAGFVDNATRVDWRRVCRSLGRREEDHPRHLSFEVPNVMAAFSQHATMLPELTVQVPLLEENKKFKGQEAHLHNTISIIRPTDIRHLQQCIAWASKHGVGLTVVGGGHSGHCLWPSVVAVDMSAFNQVSIFPADESSKTGSSALIVAEGGCQVQDIVRKAMAANATVPLGARPSVGAGLWLQGGIGHLTRLYGLACDAIVGAVVVSVDSSQILYVGRVPSQHRPAGAFRPENESDLLWAIKGAGTNFGIVVSVVFKTYAEPKYVVRNWTIPLSDGAEARLRLKDLYEVSRKLRRSCSVDAYLYWDAGQLHLGVTMFEACTTTPTTTTPTPLSEVFGAEDDIKVVDGIGLFKKEMYLSKIHGGHGGGKTSSFKRCLFLKDIGDTRIAEFLVAAVETRPSPLCYLHLLQGGGAVCDIAVNATAFGCRDWDYACVITGVWPRHQDGTEIARSAKQWVYDVAGGLLPLSNGAYGADLGPDPRDRVLAVKAFGPNGPRLARLKRSLDPYQMLAYACPIPTASMQPKLIILVTGQCGAGKDYCAEVWRSVLTKWTRRSLTARVRRISDTTKQEYAEATGADLSRLLWDRAYKEQHRAPLTTFFQNQVQQRPQLPREHFLSVVDGAPDSDVLLITGMRDEAPAATFSHLVPDSRLLEVHVQVSEQTRQIRRGFHDGDSEYDKDNDNDSPYLATRPNLIFDNDMTGNEAATRFAEYHLLSFFGEDLQRLADMVRLIPDFPRPQVEFRHVLGISQQPGGLALCTSLLQNHFSGDWGTVDAVVSCEAGGFVFASALASRVDVPLVLIREGGKLPPPTVSVVKSPSYISSAASDNLSEKRIEMERDVVTRGASVVVVDDVISSGATLCAVIQLLGEAGIDAEDVSILTVAEFPIHRGRELLRRQGYGRVSIQSLLVFGGV